MAHDFDGCVEVVRHRAIKIEDKGSKRVLIVDNENESPLSRVRIDGCVIKQSTAADWLISKEHVGDLIVELKGSDVRHALRQIHAVATYLSDGGLRQGRLGAVLLCSRYPQTDSTILRLRNEFAKTFKGSPLHIAARSVRVDFVEAISRHDAKLQPHS